MPGLAYRGGTGLSEICEGVEAPQGKTQRDPETGVHREIERGSSPASTTVRNDFLVFINYPVSDVLSQQQHRWTKTLPNTSFM